MKGPRPAAACLASKQAALTEDPTAAAAAVPERSSHPEGPAQADPAERSARASRAPSSWTKSNLMTDVAVDDEDVTQSLLTEKLHKANLIAFWRQEIRMWRLGF
jgi:hypothetical protein